MMGLRASFRLRGFGFYVVAGSERGELQALQRVQDFLRGWGLVCRVGGGLADVWLFHHRVGAAFPLNEYVSELPIVGLSSSARADMLCRITLNPKTLIITQIPLISLPGGWGLDY